jgi:hypothetical protein
LLGASSRRALLEWRARGRRTSAFCACDFQKTGWPRDFGADPAPSDLYTTTGRCRFVAGTGREREVFFVRRRCPRRRTRRAR